MGGLQVTNHKYQVSMDLQDFNSVISFKVRDRKNLTNSNHYLHYKRYKHFQLPPQIKNRFKNVRDFHKFLSQNPQVIQLADTAVIINLNEQKIRIPFQNVNEQSKIFCQTENEIMDHKNEKNSDRQIHVIIGRNGDVNLENNKQNGDNYDDCKNTLKKILKKLMKMNSPLKQPSLKGNEDIRKLIQSLQEQWGKFQENGVNVPNMTKKSKVPENEVQSLKSQLQQKTAQNQNLKIQKQILSREFNGYKQNFNLQRFAEEQRKTEEITRKKVMEDLMGDISYHFNKLSNNNNNIKIQITTKDALYSRIDNTVRELQQLRNERKKVNDEPKHFSQVFQQMNGDHHVEKEKEQLAAD